MKNKKIISLAVIFVVIISVFLLYNSAKCKSPNEKNCFKGLTSLFLKENNNKNNNQDTKNNGGGTASSNNEQNQVQESETNVQDIENLAQRNIALCQLNNGIVIYVYSNGQVLCVNQNTPEGNLLISQGYSTLITEEIKSIIICLRSTNNANIQPEQIICE